MQKYFTRVLDILSYTLSNKLTTVLNILLLPLITPHLTLLDFGSFGVYTAILYITASIIPTGQNLYLENSFFTHKQNYLLIWRRSLSVMNYSSLFYIILFIFIAYHLFSNEEYLNILVLSGVLYLFFSPYDILIRSYYVYNEKSKSYLSGNILKSILTGVTTYTLIVEYKLGYYGWVISLGLANILTVIIFAKIIWRNKLSPFHPLKMRWIKKNLSITLKLLPYQLSSQLTNLSDKLALSFFGIDLNRIGTYSQGYNFGYNAKSLVGGIFNTFAVKLQVLFRNRDFKKLGNFLFALFSVLTILSISFQLWSKEVFLLLFRKVEFVESHAIAGLVFSSIVLLVPYELINIYLVITKSAIQISKIGIFAAFFNVSLNVFLIPIFGIYAALFTTFATHFLLSISFLFFQNTREVMKNTISFNILTLLLAIHLFIAIGLYFLVDDLHLYFKIILSIILIYPLIRLIKSL